MLQNKSLDKFEGYMDCGKELEIEGSDDKLS